MTSAASYALGDLLARPGSQVRGNCLVSLGTSTVSLPVAITHGSAPGPVLAVTAGIHGAEYVPIVAVRQFIRRRYLIGNPRVSNLRFGTYDALSECRRSGEESVCDLLGG